MRLLIALPDRIQSEQIRAEMELHGWQATLLNNGNEVLKQAAACDLLLLHACLPNLDGQAAGNALARSAPICPPRVLYICPPEMCSMRPAWADCMVPAGAGVHQLCALLQILAQKPLPKLAAVHGGAIENAVEDFLCEIGMDARFKGRAYAAWMLKQLIPSAMAASQPVQALYTACAQAFHATPSGVERCVRVAVESVFTQGSLAGIERFFGTTIDPERGKPTNRAFLMQASCRLRHSFTAARSPNSSEMHHNPAAPTSV